MNELIIKFIVTTSEDFAGNVVGQLTRIGAWLDGVEYNDNRFAVKARIPIDEVIKFEAWINFHTKGNASLEKSEYIIDT